MCEKINIFHGIAAGPQGMLHLGGLPAFRTQRKIDVDAYTVAFLRLVESSHFIRELDFEITGDSKAGHYTRRSRSLAIRREIYAQASIAGHYPLSALHSQQVPDRGDWPAVAKILRKDLTWLV